MHSFERAEVFIKRTVLVDENDDVLDVIDGAGLGVEDACD